MEVFNQGLNAAVRQAQVVSFLKICLLSLAWGTATGLFLSIAVRKVRPYMPKAAMQESWDRFVREDAANRWVIVGLEGGGAYAGMLRSADVSVNQDERDIVLAEPAIFDKGAYQALNYSMLFLPARLVSSVATVPNTADLRQRVTVVGAMLFSGEHRAATRHPHSDSPTPSSDTGGCVSCTTRAATAGSAPAAAAEPATP